MKSCLVKTLVDDEVKFVSVNIVKEQSGFHIDESGHLYRTELFHLDTSKTKEENELEYKRLVEEHLNKFGQASPSPTIMIGMPTNIIDFAATSSYRLLYLTEDHQLHYSLSPFIFKRDIEVPGQVVKRLVGAKTGELYLLCESGDLYTCKLPSEQEDLRSAGHTIKKLSTPGPIQSITVGSDYFMHMMVRSAEGEAHCMNYSPFSRTETPFAECHAPHALEHEVISSP